MPAFWKTSTFDPKGLGSNACFLDTSGRLVDIGARKIQVDEMIYLSRETIFLKVGLIGPTMLRKASEHK